MIVDDIDLGPSHPWLGPQVGQQASSVIIEGSRTLVWARGRVVEREDVTFWAQAWQGVGGQPARSLGAIQYLVRQLEERASGAPEPVYIQWSASAASGAYNVADAHDGWYVIEAVQPNYLSFLPSGFCQVKLTVSQVAVGAPASLSMRWNGGALASTYTTTPLPTISYPLGSTVQVPTALSRTGGEGTVPYSVLASGSTINPALFVRGTVAQLFQGGVRVYDTINTSSNPIPTSGAFANANWVQVYSSNHNFVGDCVVTNGLLLLFFQVGLTASPRVYVWNTSLGTPTWAQVFDWQYYDNSISVGTLREVNIDRISLREVKIRTELSTANGNYANLFVKLFAGSYAAYVEYWPRTQANTAGLSMLISAASAAKIVWNENGPFDLGTNPVTNLGVGTVYGFAGIFGQTANAPLYGFMYQNPPASGQPAGNSTTTVGFGDTSGPALNSFRLYGFWALPFTTVPNLQAEGESGSLGTGWSSVADGAASAGNAAKAASGTASTNADLFGTSWVPPAGMYDVWFRLKVTSNASSTAQMQLGLWDATAGSFVSSSTYAPNIATTSYAWYHVSGGSPITPTAGHNMQFRAVTTATLTTDWFIDEAVLLPIKSATLGQGNFPADLYAQWAFDRVTNLVRG